MKKVVTFGELMLRITPPGREMILQTPNMVWHLRRGGGECRSSGQRVWRFCEICHGAPEQRFGTCSDQ